MKDKYCEVCGKATRKVLFKGDPRKIYICSRKCEYEYFESLHGKDKARQEVLRYLDKRIAQVKKLELGCWMIAVFGGALLLLSIFIANTSAENWQLVGSLFFLGAAPLTGSMLVMSQISKEKQILAEKRRNLDLAYS
jgi:hypothetical protein